MPHVGQTPEWWYELRFHAAEASPFDPSELVGYYPSLSSAQEAGRTLRTHFDGNAEVERVPVENDAQKVIAYVLISPDRDEKLRAKVLYTLPQREQLQSDGRPVEGHPLPQRSVLLETWRIDQGWGSWNLQNLPDVTNPGVRSQLREIARAMSKVEAILPSSPPGLDAKRVKAPTTQIVLGRADPERGWTTETILVPSQYLANVQEHLQSQGAQVISTHLLMPGETVVVASNRSTIWNDAPIEFGWRPATL